MGRGVSELRTRFPKITPLAERLVGFYLLIVLPHVGHLALTGGLIVREIVD